MFCPIKMTRGKVVWFPAKETAIKVVAMIIRKIERNPQKVPQSYFVGVVWIHFPLKVPIKAKQFPEFF